MIKWKNEKINKYINDDDDGDDQNSSQIETEFNRIYFFSDVDRFSVLKLVKKIKEIDIQISNKINEWELPEKSIPINLHINSFGGDLFAGLSAVDHIQNCKNPIHTIVDGAAASAASLMAVVGHKRSMFKNSYILIHQLSTWHAGTYEQLKDEVMNCDNLMTTLRNIYKENTNIPPKKLEEILKRDLWLSSEDCLKYGLVDEII